MAGGSLAEQQDPGYRWFSWLPTLTRPRGPTRTHRPHTSPPYRRPVLHIGRCWDGYVACL